jgi:hypothetical protein
MKDEEQSMVSRVGGNEINDRNRGSSILTQFTAAPDSAAMAMLRHGPEDDFNSVPKVAT